MLDVKNNFRNKNNDTLCRACGDVEETQTHVLEECRAIHTKYNSRQGNKNHRLNKQRAHPRLEPPWNQVMYTKDRIE